MIVSELPWALRVIVVEEEIESRLAELRQIELDGNKAVRGAGHDRCVSNESMINAPHGRVSD